MIFKELTVALLLAVLVSQITSGSSEDLKAKLEEKKLALLEKVKGDKKTGTTPAAETPAATPADKPDKTASQKTPDGGKGRPNCGNGGGRRTRGLRGGGRRSRGRWGGGRRMRGHRGRGGPYRG
ncbi:hypothetical protein J6590_060011 [Homalodisca vitripennis]|nr:hypothetical protein J6590_060011 [Homalodisca vitripennis]